MSVPIEGVSGGGSGGGDSGGGGGNVSVDFTAPDLSGGGGGGGGTDFAGGGQTIDFSGGIGAPDFGAGPTPQDFGLHPDVADLHNYYQQQRQAAQGASGTSQSDLDQQYADLITRNVDQPLSQPDTGGGPVLVRTPGVTTFDPNAPNTPGTVGIRPGPNNPQPYVPPVPAKPDPMQGAANTAAANVAASGGTPEQIAMAAAATVLASDKRQLSGESPETQARFVAQAGGDKEAAARQWAREHSYELSNIAAYGVAKPQVGAQPTTAGARAGLGPSSGYRPGLGLPTVRAPAAAPAPAVVRPGAAPAGAAAPAAGAPPGQLTPQQAAGKTPEQIALEADQADLPNVPRTPLGSIVNADDPVQAALKVIRPDLVDQYGGVAQSFQQEALRTLSVGGPDADRLLDPIAKAAWYRAMVISGQRPDVPENAPRQWVEDWKATWRGGGDEPLAGSLNSAIRAGGFETPADRATRLRGQGQGASPAPAPAPAGPALQAPEPPRLVSAPDGGPTTVFASQVTPGRQADQGGAGDAMLAASPTTGYAGFSGPDTALADLPYTPGGNGAVMGSEEGGAVSGPVVTSNGAAQPVMGSEEGGAVSGPVASPPPTAATNLSDVPRPMRNLWGEWMLAGGSGDWAEFRQHAQRVGSPDPGPLLGSGAPGRPEAYAPAATTARVLDTVVAPRMEAQFGAGTPEGTGVAHVAHGIAAGERWAEPYVDDVARRAWVVQTQGRQGGAANAPQDYIDAWKRSWKGGAEVPLGRDLDNQLGEYGAAPPGNRGVGGVLASNRAGMGANLAKWGDGLAPNQFEMGYSHSTAEAACGISAGVALARSRGIDISSDEALRRATDAGWTANGGMNGTSNEVRFLRSLGVDVTDSQPVDMATVRASAVAGLPVVIDTTGSPSIPAGHYFAIYGYDSRTDRYLVGGSGTALRGGNAWMSPTEMTSLVGAPRNMILQSQPAVGPQTVAVTGRLPAASGGGSFADESQVRQFQQEVRTQAPLPDQLDTTNREHFMQQWAPTLQYIQDKTGLDAGTVMGIIMAENGGTDTPVTRQNNWFSIRPTGASEGMASYPNATEALNRFVGMVSHPENDRYNDAWANRRDPDKFISGLIKGGYAPKSENNQAQWRANILSGREQYLRTVGSQRNAV